MLEIKKNVNLRNYTSLKVGDIAKYFVIVKNEEDLKSANFFAKENKLDIVVLGGGTNILITKKLNCLVIKNEIKGISILKETKNHVFVLANSGEIWSALVDYAINKKLAGIENLYYVPGTVGAAPIQNIGAYGKELKDNFFSLKAYDFKTGKYKEFSKKDCQFAYRDSVFKNKYKNRFFILNITLKLDKKPKLVLDYGQVRERLLQNGIKKPNILEVAKIIKEIRNEKLPNPAILPNAGSFFKNPQISLSQFKKLKNNYPNIPNFKGTKKTLIKIPAGWLIEKAGFKGKRFDSVGMYEKQALILVNYNKAKAKDILALVLKVKHQIYKQFQIKLEEEVNIL